MKSEFTLRYRYRNGCRFVALGSGTNVGVLPHANSVRSGQRQSGGRSSVVVSGSKAHHNEVYDSNCGPGVIWRLRGDSRAAGFGQRINSVTRYVGSVLASPIPASAQVRHNDGMGIADRSAVGSVFVVEIERKVKYGQSLCIVGNSASLGNWDAAKSLGVMQWNEGDIWKCEIELDQLVKGADGDRLEFKCVVMGSTGDISEWEGGENHSLSWQEIHNSIRIRARVVWDKKCEFHAVAKGEADGGQASAEVGLNEEPLVRGTVGNGVLESQELEQWSGKETVFMQQNDHPRERVGLWNTDGLQGIALSLVAGDREAGRQVGLS